MDNDRLDGLIAGLTRKTEVRNTDNRQATSNTIAASIVATTYTASESEPKEEERFCTIVETNTVQKIRIIARREGLMIKEVVGAAFQKAISSYEQKHGAIVHGGKGNSDRLF